MSNDDYGLAESVLAKTPRKQGPKPKKKIHEMHIRHVHGGFHVRHTHEAHRDEEFVVPDMDAMHDHLEKHMGEPNEGEAHDEPKPGETGENEPEQA